MILILSQKTDKSTEQVIDWLQHLCSIPIVRINDDDFVSSFDIELCDNGISISLLAGDYKISLSEIGCYWYRRGQFINRTVFPYKSEVGKNWCASFLEDIKKELTALFEFTYEQLNEVYHINAFKDNLLNKLVILKCATKVGLKIPETRITNSKEKITRICNAAPQITKGISQLISYHHNDTVYSAATERVTDDVIAIRSSDSLPSLFQNEIKKIFEIRSYFLDGKFYSMAIFSQNDIQTQLDYRNYNFERMNRTVPFMLPALIEKKLRKLMKLANLNSGSVDMIYNCNGEYVFLEVNPIGQFGMVSYPCNYNLERRIAEALITNHK